MSIDPLSSNAFALLQTIRSSVEQKTSMLRQAFNQALEAVQKGNESTAIGVVQAVEILKLKH